VKFIVLHLSDLHIKERGNYILERVAQIKDAVQTVAQDVNHFFIVICGDIAFSGKAEQYKVVSDFLEDLESKLKTIRDSIKLEYVLVPGNHDCDLENGAAERDTIICNAIRRPNTVDTTSIQKCTSVQSEFFQLLALLTAEDDVSDTGRLYYKREFSIGKYSVRFNCYNTAWMTQREEQTKAIVFPLSILPKTESECDLVFSVLHHPCLWLAPQENKVLKEYLDRTSNIILTGHEHIPTQYTQKRITGEENVYIEGGVLQQPNEGSSFNILIVNLERRSYKFYEYSWENGIYRPVGGGNDWEPIHRNKFLRQDKFLNNAEYNSYLNDPGATFKHPIKGDLSLPDIYEYPDLNVIGAKDTVIVESKRVPQYMFDSKKVIIFGDDRAGKTCLLKTLYQYFLDHDVIPLMIDGASIVSAKEEKIRKLLDNSFSEQYSSDYLEDYKQLGIKNKALFIDNYDKAKLKQSGRARLLSLAKTNYETIVLTANELVDLEEAMQYPEEFGSLVEFKRVGIREFGHLQRSRVVERWFYLGRDETTEDVEVEHRIASVESVVNTVLGENLLPSYPIFLLTILQALEAGVPHSTALGAYGYLYEFLITQALAITSRKIDLDTAYKYLSEVAYYMFIRNITQMAAIELQQFHSYYCQEYIRLSLEDTLKDLMASHMLTYQHGYCTFKYRYIYYYFAAREMNARLQDPAQETEIRGQIKGLIKSIHKEDCANILIFLSYLSQDPFIRDEMLKNAKEIFKPARPCNLDTDVAFINKMGFELMALSLPETNHKRAKEQHLMRKDEGKRVFTDKDGNDLADEGDVDSQLVVSVNTAFKTIQVIGQVLRNFAGSMRGDIKYRMVEECYLVGLRTLEVILEMIEANLEAFRLYIKKWATEHYEIDGTEREVAIQVNEFCYRLLEFFILGILRMISRATGSGKLSDVYERIQEAFGLLSVTLINMATNLEHSPQITQLTQHEIIELDGELKHNTVAKDILRHLVYDRLVLYTCDYQIKQALCKELGIPIKDPRLIDSAQRKTE
jgi:hypothetical protein